MSGPKLHPYAFKETSLLTFRLYEMIIVKGGMVLRSVLEWGTPRRKAGQHFDEYLVQVKAVPRAVIRKIFNNSQRQKMKRNPTFGEFDVSLLFLCIQFGCDGLQPPRDPKWLDPSETLEWYLTTVKNFRNDLLHAEYQVDSVVFISKTEELRDLLTKTLTRAAEVFKIDSVFVQKLINELDNDINNIRDKPLEGSSDHVYLSDSVRHCVSVEGKADLKKKYRQLSQFGPASNLLGDNITVRVDNVFTEMKIVNDDDDDGGGAETQQQKGDTDIEYDDLLEILLRYQEKDTKINMAVLLEGPAGSGKTTLTRKMISDWASETSTMKHLLDFDLVVLCECRDKSIVSLTQLLESLMPSACRRVHREDLSKCVEDRKILFIIDGLDEINPCSEKVFRQILKMGETNDITVLCTTRPNKVAFFKFFLPDNFAVLKVKIIGIAERKREEFVRNYCQALICAGKSSNISGLLHFMKRTERRLQDHWRLPFNLVLLTLLWFLDPKAVNSLSTATELFMATHRVSQRKLQKRLFDHEKTRVMEPHEIKDKTDKILRILYKEALVCHHGDDTALSEASVLRLQDTSTLLNLPVAEILSAFLVQATSVLDGSKIRYSFPHKSLQEFYAALYVTETLVAEELSLDLSRIISTFENSLQSIGAPTYLSEFIDKQRLQEHLTSASHRSIRSVIEDGVREVAKLHTDKKTIDLNLNHYQNVLTHCTGLLHYMGQPMNDDRAAEIVKLLKASGIIAREQWLDLLAEVKCHTMVSKYIAFAMDLTGEIQITDSNVEAYASVLGHAQPTRVAIAINSDTRDVPALPTLLEKLNHKACQVRIDLRSDFRHPRSGGSVLDHILQQFFQSCRVTHFSGQLSNETAKKLPKSLEVLRVAVADDDHYREISPTLSALKVLLPRLEILWIHIPAGIDVSLFRPLPQVLSLHLTLSNVSEKTVGWASRATCALQPLGGVWYRTLMFPGLASNVHTCEQLFLALAARNVRVGVRIEVSPQMTSSDRLRLNDLIRRYKISSEDDDHIWNWLL